MFPFNLAILPLMLIKMLGNFAKLAVLCRGVLGLARNNISFHSYIVNASMYILGFLQAS